MNGKKGFRPPKAESWMTTDEDERKRRRERASLESMKVRAVDAPDGFGGYEVSHPAADRRIAVYQVEIRDLDTPVNTCDCPDFAKSGLGTCKHIERALKTAARKCGARRHSACGEVFMGLNPQVPMFFDGGAMARFALGVGDADADINPISAAELVVIQGELNLQPVDSETLDLAVNGADLPNAVQRVRHFTEECRLMI